MNVARLAGYTALAVLGVLVGVSGTLVQGGWFPGGLLLALVAAGGLFYGGTLLMRTRLGAVIPAAGWALTVLPLVMWSRPEGDFLVTGLSPGVFLYGGVIAAVICATLAPPGESRFGGLGHPGGRPK
ncbi:DUF6113 family protein [Streptomyces gobiensis]|uniref:DUF6113 family protein n=1 Tax=Streptomyces gobiensis TaxID=2875706 RepID=UPI001E4D2FF3|nr:DUF6113 family protein [Streptomyces gobiensis]UGY93468.1 DUF6113 family protein [Streptomyces gobiensis]